MVLTNKQQEGLKIALERYKEGKKYTVISGYAGSGKSTLIKFIIAALGVDNDRVAYVAYTGKAATVLAEKGCPNATTAHKLLYYSKQMPDGKFIHKARPSWEIKYDIIVVDEVSMLPKSLWDLLVSHNVYVIACGDPFQLPPVDKTDTHDLLDNPHIFLDEIMRQAQESEIIQMSMLVREGKPLPLFKGKEVQVISKDELKTGMYSWADQILCATNRTRNEINAQMRAMNQLPSTPQEGDKIISLRNHWDEYTNMGSPMTNGVIGTIKNLKKESIRLPKYILEAGKIDTLIADIELDNGELFYNVCMDYKSIVDGEKALNGKQEYLFVKNKTLPEEPPFEMAYGYAITVWKAQGSEWDNVLLFEESFPFDKVEHQKYLYTGITRAAKKIVIVKG